MRATLLAATTALALGIPAVAGAQTAAPAIGADDVITLDQWGYDALYREGWSAEEFMDEMEVYGPTGEEIGDVENIVVGGDGRILSIIAEVGGFWDLGDTHVSVPWDKVELDAAGERITIPLTEDTVEDYSLYRADALAPAEAASRTQTVDDDVTASGRAWKVSELIGDYARLKGGENYGYVTDVIFGRDGTLKSVVVNPDVTYGVGGYYAYPYYGYGRGFDPGMESYELPYDRDAIAEAEPFDYEAFE